MYYMFLLLLNLLFYYYHRPHKFWIIAGRMQITTLYPKIPPYLTMRDGGFLFHPSWSTWLSWSFILTWCCTLNWLTKILMRAAFRPVPHTCHTLSMVLLL